MDVYADEQYYREVYGGEITDDKELNKLLQRASRRIDSLTHNRIAARGLEGLSKFQLERICRACCCLADYLKETDGSEHISSFSALDIKVSYNSRLGAAERHGCCEEAWGLLAETGLLRNVV